MSRSLCRIAVVLLLFGCGSPSGDPPAASAGGASTAGDAEVTPVHDTAPETAPMTDQNAAPAVELRNRLGDETSPYLLQHAKNPVHWFGWGPEAFEAARALGRPIFLSVGYSTCYWCHVMERESFESEAVAEILNAYFVCIKVDREERPDVDDIYMNAVHLLNSGQGGWPMSVFMEPDGLKPFLAGTYFPPTDSYGRPSFSSVLRQVADFWKTRRPEIVSQAERVATRIAEVMGEVPGTATLDAGTIEACVQQVMAMHDTANGGFVSSPQKSPKFPIPVTLDFLIAAAWDQPDVRAAVVQTLDRMATGGMNDQIGGGFHRYSTDTDWLVPHFEKMLYDNGQLVSTYAEAYARTDDAYYARTVRRTLDYVLREMTDATGMFYSAQDAEVNHREGQNYLWLPDQVTTALNAVDLGADVEIVLKAYGLDTGTNFQDPHHPEDPPQNVVHLIDRPDAIAEELDIDEAELLATLERADASLLAVRDARDQPGLDDKILTGWNGLMIRGMADAGRILEEPRYVDAARRCADALLGLMRQPDGSLLRTARNGKARIDAFLEDYALLIDGLLALHRATDDAQYLSMAEALAAAARSRFWDDRVGGYFDTLEGQSDLFVRTRSSYDGAVPCGNSVMAVNLARLHQRTANSSYLDDAVATLRSLSATLAQRPANTVLAAIALQDVLAVAPDRLGAVAVATTDANATGGSSAAPRTRPPSDKPLTVEADPKRIRIAEGEEVTVDVVLTIGKGYHVNAREPGIDYLIPLEITMLGGGGLEMVVEYPKGETYAGPEGTMLVHHGSVTVPVRLRRVGPITGKPSIMLAYQICTDETCLAPESMRIPMAFIAK